RLRHLPGSFGRPRAGVVERERTAEGRLARRPRRGPRRRRARRQARADRYVGDVVQELPDDGQDDAGGSVGEGGARRLREDQVPGGIAGRVPGARSDAAIWRGWSPYLRGADREESGVTMIDLLRPLYDHRAVALAF